MNHINSISGRMAQFLVFGLALVVAALPAEAYEEVRTFDTDRLTVHNLIGEVHVEAGGSSFEVVVNVQGSGATKGAVTLDVSGDELQIIFPENESSFVYPRLGKHSDTNLRVGSGDWLSRMSDRKRIRVSGSGSGLELWADVTVRVPSGSQFELKHGVGTVRVDGVEGELELATRSGDVVVERTYGDLAIATGSGSVEAMQVNGDDIQIATGSGEVKVDGVDGDELQVATGSGSIELSNVRGREIQAATGSGEVEARSMSADSVEIGTGSGEVVLELDQMGNGAFSIGTGSGNIELIMPSGASADIHAETDGGRVRVEVAGPAEYRVRENDEVEMVIGSGGARVRLGSGSGNIKIAS